VSESLAIIAQAGVGVKEIISLFALFWQIIGVLYSLLILIFYSSGFSNQESVDVQTHANPA
jgi:hypothetical protein